MADTYQQTPFRNEFCKAEQFTPQPPKVLKHAICSLKDLLHVHVHIISYSASTCIKVFKGARVDWCSGESIHLPPVLPGFNFISSVNAVNGLNRGYYMVARRYEFYFRVAKHILRTSAASK